MQKPEDVSVLEKWFSLEIANVFKRLDSRESGLTESEVQQRLEKFGPNRLTPPVKKSAWVLFFMQFHNLIIYILLVSAALTAIMAHWIDAGVIFGVVIINAAIGFIQEGKAEKALDAIRKMMSLEADVVRNGQKVLVSAETLVPGDIVFWSPATRFRRIYVYSNPRICA